MGQRVITALSHLHFKKKE